MRANAMRAGAAWLLVPLAMACANSTRYRELSEDWQRGESAAPAADGEDSLFEGAAVLDRAEVIRQILARNPTVRAARDAWRASLARYPQVTALADPSFSYDLRPRSIGSNAVHTANDFGVSQAIPFPGKLALRGASAVAEAESAQGDVETQRVALAALASRLFDEYWLAERVIEINARHVELLDDAQRVALSRYAAGTGTQQDVLAAETEQGMLAHRERELAAGKQILVERLNTLLHRDPTLPLPPPPRELDTVPTPELDLRALIARALEHRPELHALAARVRARESEVALARREFLPDFTVRGGYQTTWQDEALQPVVGVELNVPLQLGRRRAALDEAGARLSREQSLLRRLEDRVRLEVASAVERLCESQHQLEISQQRRLPPARDRVIGARAGFASGRATFLEFVDAERSLLAAEQSDYEVRADLSVRHAALGRALGEIPAPEGEHP
jgi:outer membrane protein, heavy metal efflux system